MSLFKTSQKKREYKAVPAKKPTYAWVADKNTLHGGQYQEVEDCGLLTLTAGALALLKAAGVTPDGATFNFSDERTRRMDPNRDGLVTRDELQTYYEKELIRDAFDDYVRKQADATLPKTPYNPSPLVQRDFFRGPEKQEPREEERRYFNIGGGEDWEREQNRERGWDEDNIEEGRLDGIFGGERSAGPPPDVVAPMLGSKAGKGVKPLTGVFITSLLSEFEDDWRTLARINMKIRMDKRRGLATTRLQHQKQELLRKFTKMITTAKEQFTLTRRQRDVLTKLPESLNQKFDESKLRGVTKELKALLL